MKKFIVLSFVVLAVAFTYDFRKTNWGMNEEEVKATEEGEPLFDEDGMLLYEGQAAGFDCYVGYLFVDHYLVQGKYIFFTQRTENFDYFRDYTDIKDSLILDYGRPSKDTICWLDDPNKYNAFQWGDAIAAGKLVLRCEWITLTSNIYLALYSKDSEIKLVARFDDYAYIESQKEQKKQEK